MRDALLAGLQVGGVMLGAVFAFALARKFR